MSAKRCVRLDCPVLTHHKSGLCEHCRTRPVVLLRELDPGPCACPLGAACAAPPCPWFNAGDPAAPSCTCHRCEAVPELLEVASETLRRVSR